LLKKTAFEETIAIPVVSGMLQGIQHYTGSLRHINKCSFRDAIFTKVLVLAELDTQKDLFNTTNVAIETAVSSDDCYENIVIKTSQTNIKRTADILKYFKIVTSISDVLFNMERSVKSSYGSLILEFNQVFGTLESLVAASIKHSIRAVEVFSTRSPRRMIAEAFNGVRALRENGGSSLETTLAHWLNKEWCESIYWTRVGDVNEPILPLYDLGFYPLFAPEAMEMLGPEYMNYKTLMQGINGSDQFVINFMTNLYRSQMADNEEYSFSDIFNRATIHASMGTPNLLKEARRKTGWDRESISRYVIDRPRFVLEKAETVEEIEIECSLKLHSEGAFEHYKRINPLLYVARSNGIANGAFFMITNSDERMTFKDCVNTLKQPAKPHLLMNEQTAIKMHFQDLELYEKVDSIIALRNKAFLTHKTSYQRFTKNQIRTESSTLAVPVKVLLKYKWFQETTLGFSMGSMSREWFRLTSAMPQVSASIPDTVRNLTGEYTGANLIAAVNLINFRFERRPFHFKCFKNGKSSRSFEETLESFLLENRLPNRVFSRIVDNVTIHTDLFDVNQILMNIFNFLIKHDVPHPMSVIENHLLMNGVPIINKILLSNLDPCKSVYDGDKKNLMTLYLMSMDLRVVKHGLEHLDMTLTKWDKEQLRSKDKETYEGDFTVSINCGGTTLSAEGRNGSYYLSVNPNYNSHSLYKCIEKLTHHLTFTEEGPRHNHDFNYFHGKTVNTDRSKRFRIDRGSRNIVLTEGLADLFVSFWDGEFPSLVQRPRLLTRIDKNYVIVTISIGQWQEKYSYLLTLRKTKHVDLRLNTDLVLDGCSIPHLIESGFLSEKVIDVDINNLLKEVEMPLVHANSRTIEYLKSDESRYVRSALDLLLSSKNVIKDDTYTSAMKEEDVESERESESPKESKPWVITEELIATGLIFDIDEDAEEEKEEDTHSLIAGMEFFIQEEGVNMVLFDAKPVRERLVPMIPLEDIRKWILYTHYLDTTPANFRATSPKYMKVKLKELLQRSGSWSLDEVIYYILDDLNECVLRIQ
jgi:hypothetical protein